MRLLSAALAATIVLSAVTSFAQDPSSPSARPQSSPTISIPRLINLSGMFRPADGAPVSGAETVTFAIYADETGGTPIWEETQNVNPDVSGRYSVLLGATRAEGVPLEVFASGEARWLGMIWTRGGESQARRSRLTFVPYAVHATDADTLGGKPASAYALTSSTNAPATGSSTTSAADPVNTNTVLTGTPGQLAKYAANGVDIMGATTVESGGRLGVGTAAPLDYVHAQFTDASGGFTGFAVQNLSGGAAAYSGTLFYDQNGALGQFQGFNNSTHEYRINNVAKNGASVFNGSINFMVGGTSRFFVNSGFGVGIGTSAPATNLEVSNASTGVALTNIFSTTYANSGAAGAFIGRHARGTPGAPAAIATGDNLAAFLGVGFGTTTFSASRGGMFVRAAENWTDAAQGTQLFFNVTSTGTTSPFTAMTVSSSGDLGIGTTSPNAPIHIERNGDAAIILQAAGVNGVNGPSAGIFAASSRGTILAPAAVQAGDQLGYFATGGSDGGGPSEGVAGGLGVVAAENWTFTAHGAAVGIFATPNGAVDPVISVGVLPNGNVGIGTPLDGNGIPTAADKLQVSGDIRVGTGTTGCVKDADATVIAGVCSSDRRLKKDITPFGSSLDSLSRLQPVHFYWRSDEYPDRHFGTRQSFGLIAQDVEQVLPELVETDKDGFKAINYSKLPLFTIQAVKELKAENDALKQQVAEIDPLKQRVADLERRLAELAAAMNRR